MVTGNTLALPIFYVIFNGLVIGIYAIVQIWEESGFARLFNFENGGWKNLIMIAIACVLIYLAVKKGYEPLLLLPIAFGMLLVNLPLSKTRWFR